MTELRDTCLIIKIPHTIFLFSHWKRNKGATSNQVFLFVTCSTFPNYASNAVCGEWPHSTTIITRIMSVTLWQVASYILCMIFIQTETRLFTEQHLVIVPEIHHYSHIPASLEDLCELALNTGNKDTSYDRSFVRLWHRDITDVNI